MLETVGINSPKEQNTINGCLQIFNWITAVASAFLTASMKRRTQFMISITGMLTILALQTLCAGLFNERGNVAAGLGVVPLLFFFYLCYNLAFNALLYSYPIELLPYPIRAKGMSVLMFFGKGAALINAYVNPVGLKAIGWKYYIVYVVWLGIEAILVYFVFVETKGTTLEATSAAFDRAVAAPSQRPDSKAAVLVIMRHAGAEQRDGEYL